MLGTGYGLSAAILVSNLLLFSQVSNPENRFVSDTPVTPQRQVHGFIKTEWELPLTQSYNQERVLQ